MTSRGRYNTNEWDLLKEDFNSSTYDPQYPDDDVGGGVQLDHCRLYIRNIPKALNDEGLRTAFSKYGTLTEVYVSRDPVKKYALVRFETPGEAKLALTKLNNTDPLKLSVSIAHKNNRQSNYTRDNFANGPRRSFRDDNSSVSSRDKSFRRQDDMTNGDEMDEPQLPLDDNMDSDTQMKGLQLELERLQVQEKTVLLRKQLLELEAARKKNLTQSTTSNRCILPDGRIVVRNVNERNLESRDIEGSFAAGAGDSRVASHACVACGAPADSYCSRCGLTPYCSPRCQRRDWAERHRAVCHNLARLSSKPEAADQSAEDNEVLLPPAAPLRRPHSPKREPQRNEDAGSDKGPKYPQQTNSPAQNKQGGSNFNHGPRNFNRPSGDRPKRDRSQGDRPQGNRHQGDKPDGDRPQENRSSGDRPQGNRPIGDKQGYRPQGGRPPLRHDNKDDGETWEHKNNKPTPATTPTTTATPKPPASTPKPPAEVPKPAATGTAPTPKVNGVKPPGSLTDATPAKKLVPRNYLIELLSVGDTALLSVESAASECRTKRVGHVCVSVHETYENDYQQLCEQYTVDCEAEGKLCEPKPGESFSYLNPDDGGWYRARLLTPTLAALVDSGKVVKISRTDKLKPLPAKYERPPEFCCLLNASSVQVGHNLKCTLVSKTSEGFKVTLENVETGEPAGGGEISRWVPEVEHPPPPAPTITPAAQPQLAIPEIPRPDVVNNSTVLLVDATALDCAFVRPSDHASQRQYDTVLQDTVLYGQTATPLKEPPQKGQVVIAKFSDGLHYRALCKRTNVKQNKYLLEYIEFGNVEITPLENIYPCPPNLELSVQPAQATLVTFQCKCTSPLTPPALQYIEKLKDGTVELTLTIPSGDKTAPNGSSVCLTVVKTKESVNRKLEEMCTPEWKKIEEKGGDVIDTKPLMYSDLEYQELPADGCTLDVLDISAITDGSLSACRQGTLNLDRLTEQMAAYCDSEIGKEPYLPKFEELCIAKFPPYPHWFRAVLLEQTPGSATARVCYVDYGNVAEVSVEMLRKMLPEFVRGLPALASHLEVKDFPENVTPDQLGRAIEHMKINDEGRGVLTVTKCKKLEGGLYLVHAPDLIKAMRG